MRNCIARQLVNEKVSEWQTYIIYQCQNTIQTQFNGRKMGERWGRGGKKRVKAEKKHNLEFEISKFLNFRTLRRAKKLQSDFK